MYLGSDYKYYSSLELPQYMIRKFRKEYIVNDCIKGWFQSEWDVPANANDMLSNMIYQGKLLYFSQALAPDMNDTIRIGFTSNQLQWCKDNEQKIWSFFIFLLNGGKNPADESGRKLSFTLGQEDYYMNK